MLAASIASAARSRRRSRGCCRRAQCCSSTATTTPPRCRPLCTAHSASLPLELLGSPTQTSQLASPLRPELSPVHESLCQRFWTLLPVRIHPQIWPRRLSRPRWTSQASTFFGAPVGVPTEPVVVPECDGRCGVARNVLAQRSIRVPPGAS